jgi:hypothetical protein
MASVIEEVVIHAKPEDVWAALKDFGALHTRLAVGFVADSRLDGDDDRTRVVTFANGAVAREVLVGVDDDARRLAYSVVEGPLGATHHNASAQVLDGPDGTARFLWITDVLPDALGDTVRALMQQGIVAIERTHTRAPSGQVTKGG